MDESDPVRSVRSSRTALTTCDRHFRDCGEFRTWWARYDDPRSFKPYPIQIPDIGQNELRWVPPATLRITVKADYPIASIEKSSGPSSIATEQVDADWPSVWRHGHKNRSICSGFRQTVSARIFDQAPTRQTPTIATAFRVRIGSPSIVPGTKR